MFYLLEGKQLVGNVLGSYRDNAMDNKHCDVCVSYSATHTWIYIFLKILCFKYFLCLEFVCLCLSLRMIFKSAQKVLLQKDKLDWGSIRSSLRNGIGSTCNKNMEF